MVAGGEGTGHGDRLRHERQDRSRCQRGRSSPETGSRFARAKGGRLGLPDCETTSDSQEPFAGHLGPRLGCAIGDRTGIGRGKQGIENCEQRVVGRRAYNRQRRRCTSAEKHRLASSLGGARDQRRAAGESKWVGR